MQHNCSSHLLRAMLLCAQVQVSDQPLTAFGVRDDGAVLGCGTADGCCSIMQLGSALVDMVANEKQTVNAMFERETLREKNLEKAIKEAKVKARRWVGARETAQLLSEKKGFRMQLPTSVHTMWRE